MQEEWKDVKGYEGIYQVSNTGKVKNIAKDRYLTTKKNNRQYVQVRLYKNSEVEHWLLHRLVATHFIENLNNLPQVNHKDENKDNNNAENLEWCDNTYNRHYGTGIQRMAMNRDQIEIGKKYSKRIFQYDKNGNFLKEYYGAKEAERQTGISSSNIQNSMRRNYLAGGYRWQYAEVI